MTDINMTFAGVDLRPLIRVLKITRNIGNGIELTTTDNRRIGVRIHKTFIKSKTIEVSFAISSRSLTTDFIDIHEYSEVESTSLNNLKRELANIFNVTEPKPLSFSDDTEVFYNAIPTETIEIEDINSEYGIGKITFIVPDGLAHKVTPTLVSSSGNRIVADNNGGYYAVPTFEFTSASNLKMIAFTLDNKVFKLGKSTGSDIIKSGETVKIDMSDGSVFIGGNRRIYRSFDSRLIHVPVGKSNIGIAVNSGATIPIVKLKFNEVYL